MSNRQIALLCAVLYARIGAVASSSVLDNARRFLAWLDGDA